MRERKREVRGKAETTTSRELSLPLSSHARLCSLPSSAEFRNCTAEEAVAGVANGRLPPFDSLPRSTTFSSFSPSSRYSSVVFRKS